MNSIFDQVVNRIKEISSRHQPAHQPTSLQTQASSVSLNTIASFVQQAAKCSSAVSDSEFNQLAALAARYVVDDPDTALAVANELQRDPSKYAVFAGNDEMFIRDISFGLFVQYMRLYLKQPKRVFVFRMCLLYYCCM